MPISVYTESSWNKVTECRGSRAWSVAMTREAATLACGSGTMAQARVRISDIEGKTVLVQDVGQHLR